MRRRPAVAPWLTSLLVGAVLAASGCGPASDRAGGPAPTVARPTLSPVQQQPLTVVGRDFQPGEHVVLAAKGLRSEKAEADADESGAFTVSFQQLKPCDSITVVATGSKGSRASFNLSQTACAGT
jgi:hypothetical protein